jgi:hypothetical protein
MVELRRRSLLGTLLAAPVIIRTPGLLMPVRPLPAASRYVPPVPNPTNVGLEPASFLFPNEGAIWYDMQRARLQLYTGGSEWIHMELETAAELFEPVELVPAELAATE